MKNCKIAITCGDPSGVGPELISLCLQEGIGGDADLSIIGQPNWLDSLEVGGSRPFRRVEVGLAYGDHQPGRPNPESSKIALEAMEKAARGCALGEFDAVVTGPISKSRCAEVGFSHPGQTEFFASHWGGVPTMAFVGSKLVVVLATWHVPFATIRYYLTESALAMAIDRAHELGVRLGFSNPRIGVCGLNPHAGEEGLIGNEEVAIYDPLIESLGETIPSVSKCQPADTLFYRAINGAFDVVVALYHDQGLAPLKAVEFETAVNVTLGLPYVRTSPDHGTGYEIAGTGEASPKSFSRAIELAIQLVGRNRET
jgi:4-hydroxythreonine-4-phosphate dehydrogenase